MQDRSPYALPAEDVLLRLEAAPEGLSEAHRSSRLERHGRNELEVNASDPRWLTFVKQFGSPMIIFLLVAAVVTTLMREWIDTGAILVALLLNAVIGFWQERKAISDVEALRSLSSPTARVLVDGQAETVDAATVVPGDIVLLESGDRVPADVRLFEATGLRVDESMLTGEVLAVTKGTDAVEEGTTMGDRTSMCFSGTLVTAGRATGVVTATGRGSELGAINELVQVEQQKTPLQVLTHRMEKTVAGIILAIAAALFVAGLLMGTPTSELFRTIVALIVSSMPEALPIVLTIAMGVGVSRMASRHAVVRRLPSVETLGSTTVIGSDKTGTLTQNRLTVERLWTADGMKDVSGEDGPEQAAEALTDTERALLRAGAGTNEATAREGDVTRLAGDAVDVAMASVALRTRAIEEHEFPTDPLVEMPYEPDLAYSQAVLADPDGGRTLYVKGAPDRVAGFCTSLAGSAGARPFDGEARGAMEEANAAMGAEGLRVLATASRRLDDREEQGEELATPEGLTFLGLEGMADPPRPGVVEAVGACRDAGISVMMITGDHPITAASIGDRLGLDTAGEPLTGAEVDRLDDDGLRARVAETSVAARMSPQNKLRVVELLREDGETVAVTGDGVNDAPALKAASIGVAMGDSGTDVARESADVVLTDDNFVTIVDAVEQGRVTFAAIRKATFFLLANATAFLLAVTANTFTDLPLIFLPVMLLWTNLVTSGLQDVALAFEKGEGDELQQRPRPRDEGVLNRTMWIRTALTGALMGVGTLLVYRFALEAGYELDHARTLALTTMVAFNVFNVLNARTERRSALTVNPLGNPLLAASTALALLLHWGAMSWSVSASVMGLQALSLGDWGLCFLVGASVLVLVEVEKAVRRRSDAVRA